MEALQAATGEDQAQRELLAALQVDQDRLDELVDASADGTLSPADYARARARVEARMDATRTPAALPVADRALREAWASRGLGWRRAVWRRWSKGWSCIPAFGAATSSTPPVEVIWRT
jgi:hypothetical protein